MNKTKIILYVLAVLVLGATSSSALAAERSRWTEKPKTVKVDRAPGYVLGYQAPATHHVPVRPVQDLAYRGRSSNL